MYINYCQLKRYDNVKTTLTEAVKVISVSQATLYRDLKKGKVSFETDGKGRRLIDVSELERVYGELKHRSNRGKDRRIPQRLSLRNRKCYH